MRPIKDSELVTRENTNGQRAMYHIGLTPDQITPNIFFVGDPARADLVASHFDSIEHRVQCREFTSRTGKYKGMPVMVLGTGIGTDNVEISLVELFCLNEFDLQTKMKKENNRPLTIIRLGTSGSPQEDIDIGTLAISKYSLGLDNTGLYYDVPCPDEIAEKIEKEAYRIITEATPDGRRFKGKIHPYVSRSSPELVDALAKAAKENFVIGITATASGFYGPQGREITGLDITVPGLQEKLAKIDIEGNRLVNLEMESSLIAHLSQKMGYRAATMCMVIANRPKGEFLSNYKKEMERSIKAGLEAMLALYNK